MSVVLALLRRDLALAFGGGRRGGAVLPVLFFLSVAMLFPFAVGPDPVLLARAGGGVVWVAALLAAILPLDRAGERPQQPGEDAHQARLAGAVGPAHLQRLARAEVERQAAEQHPLAAAAGEVVDREGGPFHPSAR